MSSAPKPHILKSSPPKTTTGKAGRQFHASRTPKSFVDDPPGFHTEKDPRKQPSDKWFNLPPAPGTAPYHLDLRLCPVRSGDPKHPQE